MSPQKHSYLTLLLLFVFQSGFTQSENKLDSTTIDYLLNEAEQGLGSTPKNSLKIGFIAAHIAQDENDQLRLAACYKLIGKAHFYLGQTDSTKQYWLKSNRLLLPEKNKELADSYNNLGVIYLRLGQTDSSLFCQTQSLYIRKEIKDSAGVASSFLNLGALHRNFGEFDLALSYYLSALRLYEELNNIQKQGESYNSIGLLYLSLNENEKSLEYLLKSLDIKKEYSDERSIGNTINNIASAYYHIQDYNNAENYYLKAREIFTKYQDKRTLAGIQSNLGIIYKEYERFAEARIEYEQAAINFEEMKDAEGLATVYNNLGAIYFIENNFSLSNETYQKALLNSRKINSLPLLRTAYQGLFKANKSLNNYGEALNFNEKYVEINDSIFSETTAKKLAELSEKYESEKKARTIEQLEKEQLITAQKIHKRESFIWILSISGTLTLILLILLANRFKLKKKILEAQKERLQLSAKVKEKELEIKNRELTSYATSTLQKGEFLQNIYDGLEKLEYKTNDSVLTAAQLKKDIKRKLEGADDWDKFKLHFESVHPAFFEKLNAKQSSLTTNDLRNCAYIKMNLSIKEVASLLNISPKSAKMNRYRLKKKLQLEAEDSLNDFIHNIV